MNTQLAYLLRSKSTTEIICQKNLLQEDGLIKRKINNNFCRFLIFMDQVELVKLHLK